MVENKKIACVTGATGMVGKRIVECLLQERWHVRALSRRRQYVLKGTEVFYGGLEDVEVLHKFVDGARHIYHCAAELHDESKMWDVNVQGTKNLIDTILGSSIRYFLYMSSVGVVGVTGCKIITENHKCNPVTIYERSKWEAEKLVSQKLRNCRVIILRPTNVIDNYNLGVLEGTVNNKVKNRIAQYIKYGEFAHVVHAKDVAKAAIYFHDKYEFSHEKFFVSRDFDPVNTFSGLRSIYKSVLGNKHIYPNKRHVPIFIPYILKKVKRRSINWGDVKYSSQKLIDSGYKFYYDTEDIISDVLSTTLGLKVHTSKRLIPLDSLQHIKTLVVIGASGFIGKSLVKTLYEKMNVRIRVLVHKEWDNELFKDYPNIDLYPGTLFRVDTLENILLPDCTVVNLAYMENETLASNLHAMRNLSDACITKKIKRLVHCSTVGVVGSVKQIEINEKTICNPKTQYEITKLNIERYLIESSENRYELAILRPTSVFGPEGKNLIKLSSYLTRKAWPINYVRSCIFGNRSMNIVCLNNVINALVFLCDDSLSIDKEIYIISDDYNPHNNYFEIEKKLINKFQLKQYPLPRILFPNLILTFLLKLLNRPVTQSQRKYNYKKLLNAGYEQSTTIDEELNRFVDWYQKENQEQIKSSGN